MNIRSIYQINKGKKKSDRKKVCNRVIFALTPLEESR